MADTYQILLIEKDKLVADDVRRFLRASAGGAGFSVEYQEDLQHGQGSVASSAPDIVILDAAFIDKGTTITELKNLLAEKRIPVVVLSETNGKELRNKAATVGAADYLVKNKLNYFHLPKTIISAIRSNHSGITQSNSSTASHAQLLDKINEAVIVVDSKGDIIYSNPPGHQMLGDVEVVNVLRKFIDAKSATKNFKATIQIQGLMYDISVAPQMWDDKPCLSIHVHLAAHQSVLSLSAKVDLLSEFIKACTIPFLVIVNGAIHEANDTFTDMLKANSQMLEGRRLTEFITVTNGERTNLLRSPEPQMVTSIMGANVAIPMQLLSKTLSWGEGNITICSLIQPGFDDRHPLSTHRLMEIASHDLREPIRTSSNFLQLLSDGIKKEGGNKKLLSYVDTITSEIGRADRMLADMKTLMNIQDKVLKAEKISMLNLIQDTIKQLKPVIDTSDAMINVSEMPTIKVDAEDIKRVLFHLIDNALKFIKKDKRPYIELLSARTEDGWQFCIKDNGIGIDEKFHEAIFEPFRKLNRVDEYPGAGNGLCISRHIIEMHKGKIWVESHEGFGSSFFFTLPAE